MSSPEGAHQRSPAAAHYERKRPGALTKLFNDMVAALTRAGLSIRGSRVLEVRGRKSGEPRRTPVNLLELEGERYLVAPRGDTQWVRNLRAAGEGTLLVGRRRDPFSAVELSEQERAPILREYLRRWAWEVGAFFDGVSADSSERELQEAASKHPVFRLRSGAAREGSVG